MSRYGRWPRYVPVAERRAKAMRKVEKLRKKGHPVEPVIITGKAIATTFWGKTWCDNLESYHDFENRLPRGRTYVRNGSVIDLQIAPKEVRAMVSGSSIYKVDISIGALPKAVWEGICQDCAGGIDSLVELLQGRFNKGVMERLCRQDKGLFPKPSEIKFSCSCPDWASMCKHIAAVLYGVGSRLDKRPELLFLLRAVDQNDLVAHLDDALPLASQAPEAGKRLETDDISQLFGLEMAQGDVGGGQTEEPRPVKKTSVAKTPAAKTGRKKKSAKAGKPRSVAAKEQEKTAWLEIEDLISRRNEPGYKKATARLIELRDDAGKSGKIEEFSRRLATLRACHERKRRFIARLDAAGLG
uniref:Uncharacterized conserved protein, contains Zn finger domain n=1 Tax=Candidatus Kentrum sp. DK TaxID=2126562 RepID=A0A450SQR4_9GAMM|nr:MAG: Uncharacterized conserved protein, contains Zn finger domain [Candidatus Kentron sp. DK]